MAVSFRVVWKGISCMVCKATSALASSESVKERIYLALGLLHSSACVDGGFTDNDNNPHQFIGINKRIMTVFFNHPGFLFSPHKIPDDQQ